MTSSNSHAEYVHVNQRCKGYVSLLWVTLQDLKQNYSDDLANGKYTLKNIKLKLYKVPSWTDEMCFIPLQRLGNLNQSLGKTNRSSECLPISSAMLDRNRTAENSFFLVHMGFC